MVSSTIFLGPDKEAVDGHVQNFSESGAQFTCPHLVADGTMVYFGFYLGEHTDRPRCEATGRVVRSMPFGALHGIAVQFQLADDNFIGFLQQLANSREVDRPELLGQIRELEIHIT